MFESFKQQWTAKTAQDIANLEQELNAFLSSAGVRLSSAMHVKGRATNNPAQKTYFLQGQGSTNQVFTSPISVPSAIMPPFTFASPATHPNRAIHLENLIRRETVSSGSIRSEASFRQDSASSKEVCKIYVSSLLQGFSRPRTGTGSVVIRAPYISTFGTSKKPIPFMCESFVSTSLFAQVQQKVYFTNVIAVRNSALNITVI